MKWHGLLFADRMGNHRQQYSVRSIEKSFEQDTTYGELLLRIYQGHIKLHRNKWLLRPNALYVSVSVNALWVSSSECECEWVSASECECDCECECERTVSECEWVWMHCECECECECTVSECECTVSVSECECIVSECEWVWMHCEWVWVSVNALWVSVNTMHAWQGTGKPATHQCLGIHFAFVMLAEMTHQLKVPIGRCTHQRIIALALREHSEKYNIECTQQGDIRNDRLYERNSLAPGMIRTGKLFSSYTATYLHQWHHTKTKVWARLYTPTGSKKWCKMGNWSDSWTHAWERVT